MKKNIQLIAIIITLFSIPARYSGHPRVIKIIDDKNERVKQQNVIRQLT